MFKKKLFLIIPIFLAACAPALAEEVTQTSIPTVLEEAVPSQSIAAERNLLPSQTVSSPVPAQRTAIIIAPTPEKNRRVNDQTEYRIGQMLPWDGIRPVYDPQFASATEVELQDGELVMGVFLDGEAKAYPVSVLRFREMVNDEIAGWPVLVTW